jgi:hypothetical protein
VPRFAGIFGTMLFILAVMILWGFVLRSWIARNPDSPVAKGLAFDLG